MSIITKLLSSKDVCTLNASQLEAFERLAKYVHDENEKINITSITDPCGIALKHFADSLTLLEIDEMKEKGLKMADIGCGGGFPGLPIKIVRDDIDLTMIDSTEKKIRYVQSAADFLGLSNIHPISGRAEELSAVGREMRESFDIVTARALSRLNALVELCMPFVRVGGYFISMKAATAEEELFEAKKGIAELGGKVLYSKEIKFSFDDVDMSDVTAEDKKIIEDFISAKRYLIVIKKVKATPEKYPRAWAKILKKPL